MTKTHTDVLSLTQTTRSPNNNFSCKESFQPISTLLTHSIIIHRKKSTETVAVAVQTQGTYTSFKLVYYTTVNQYRSSITNKDNSELQTTETEEKDFPAHTHTE